MRTILCLLGIHKYQKARRYLGGDSWASGLECSACGKFKESRRYTWQTTKMSRLFGGHPTS